MINLKDQVLDFEFWARTLTGEQCRLKQAAISLRVYPPQFRGQYT